MLRSMLIAAGAVLLCGAATAQQRIDPSNLYPVAGPIKDGGVYNWDTGNWTRAPGQTSGSQIASHGTVVYNNTCFWSGGAYFTGLDSCEVIYDEGRIPSPDEPGAPAAATVDNLIDGFQFAYCTFYPTGQVHFAVGFWDNIGGPCLVNGPPPHNDPSDGNAYFDMPGAFGLPGSSALGAQSCWAVTISFDNSPFCLQSNGDGVWDNDPNLDTFNWSFEQKNVTLAAGTPNGPILSGEPALNPGSCTYNIPCATDFTGSTCGTGLNTALPNSDAFFINVDNDPVGTPNTGGKCPGAFAIFGTACYWFGGYPSNPYGSFWMALTASGSCAPCTGNIATYCTAKTTSTGCVPSIGSTGTPSKSAGAGSFFVTLTNTRPQKAYIFFYSINTARNSAPFQGGFLCMVPPVRRTGVVFTNNAGACTSGTQRDFGAIMASASFISAGDVIRGEWWGRDTPGNSSLSNAIEFTVCP